MSKLWLLGLAASAAWAPMAMAQPAPPPPPPMPMHGMHGPMPMPPMPPGGPMMPGGGHMMPGRHMMPMHRIDRGAMIPPMFMGPQFVVQDWQMFGFPPPMPGGRWIRYYDDALLVDRDGRVMDGRYGWDWDGRGDRRMGDYDDDDRDGDDWAEDGGYGRDHRDGDRRVVRIYRHRDGPHGDCRRTCTRVFRVPAPPPPYGYGGYGDGYGSGCGCGGVTITETTTTTAPVVEMRTYYETVTEHRAAPRRHYSKPVYRAPPPPPRPRPGERG